jgi:hypothetical protein
VGLLMKLLNAKIVETSLFSQLESKSFICQKDSTTSLCAARTVRMPRKLVWMVEVVVVVEGEEEAEVAEVTVMEEEVEAVCAMHSRKASAPEEAGAGSPMRVVEEEEVVEEGEVEAEVAVMGEEEEGVYAMLFRRVNAHEEVGADFLTHKQMNRPVAKLLA